MICSGSSNRNSSSVSRTLPSSKSESNDGQRDLKFVTNENQGRKFKAQCAPVNKCLGCVGGITDANNLVLFHKSGGLIIPEKLVQIILPKDKSLVTTFRRHGMVYRMDAWVKRSDVEAKPDFPRRADP